MDSLTAKITIQIEQDFASYILIGIDLHNDLITAIENLDKKQIAEYVLYLYRRGGSNVAPLLFAKDNE